MQEFSSHLEVQIMRLCQAAITAGLSRTTRAVELRAQRRQGRRGEDLDANHAGKVLHGLDEREGAGAVVEVSARVALGPGAHQEDPDRRRDHGDVEIARVRQAPPHACRLGTLEQEAVDVVQELPRQAEQLRGGLARGSDLGVGGSNLERGVDVNREPAAGVAVDLGPGAAHVGR